MALLHIYDASDPGIVTTAMNRSTPGITKWGITNFSTEFISGLDAFVQSGQTFDRLLFETHGSPGRIYFNHADITGNWLTTSLTNRFYEQIFPQYTRVYFNGCNVAAEASGLNFMTSFAQIFLKTAGGQVFGHTSLGWVVPLYSWLTGHVVHLSGETRTLFVAPGGGVTETYTEDDI